MRAHACPFKHYSALCKIFFSNKKFWSTYFVPNLKCWRTIGGNILKMRPWANFGSILILWGKYLTKIVSSWSGSALIWYGSTSLLPVLKFRVKFYTLNLTQEFAILAKLTIYTCYIFLYIFLKIQIVFQAVFRQYSGRSQFFTKCQISWMYWIFWKSKNCFKKVRQ